MSSYNFNYAFNISGNCNAVVAEISGGVENLQRNLRATTSLWDTFEGKILAFNQLTQYVQNLGQAMNETLAPGATLNVIKDITGFINDLNSVSQTREDREINPGTICDFNLITVRNYYRGLREENAISVMQRLFGDNSAVDINVILNCLNWPKGEKALTRGDSREAGSNSPLFLSKQIFDRIKEISNGLRTDTETIDTFNKLECIKEIKDTLNKSVTEQWKAPDENGGLCLGLNTSPGQEPAAKNTGDKFAAESTIFKIMDIQRQQDSTYRLAALHTQRIKERDKEQRDERDDRTESKSESLFAERQMSEYRDREQSTISQSLSNVCRFEQSAAGEAAERRVINLHIDKVIDGITIYNQNEDVISDEIKTKLEECFEDVLFEFQKGRFRI